MNFGTTGVAAPNAASSEYGQILPHGMACRLGRHPLAPRRAALPVGIGLDHARINREAFAAHQSLGQAALHRAALKWSAAPPALPKGAEAVTLYGDPSKEGLFALRVKLPTGYHIPPHTHPKPEIVTVVSGEMKLGDGT